jgi:hypothetical protein
MSTFWGAVRTRVRVALAVFLWRLGDWLWRLSIRCNNWGIAVIVGPSAPPAPTIHGNDAFIPLFDAEDLGGEDRLSDAGACVPALACQGLPRFNKSEFLRTMTEEQRRDFWQQLQTGRVVGDVGERFRRYVDRYLEQRRAQQRPVEQRYLPSRHHRRQQEPISVGT